MNVRVALVSVLGALVAMLSVGVVTAPAALAGECPNEALRGGPSASLPDCRGYEQVSPENKAGYDAVPRSGTLAPAWAAPDGEGIAYLNYGSFPGAAANNAVLAAHLSLRGANGWGTTELTPPKPQAAPFESYITGYDFSENLSSEITKVPLQPLTPEATPGVYNLFLRRPDGTYSWLNAAAPPMSPEEVAETTLVKIILKAEPGPKSFFEFDEVALAGASADFRHLLFSSNAPLTTEASGGPLGIAANVYETVETKERGKWKVRLAGLLPDGTAPAEGSNGGGGSEPYYVSGSPSADKRVEHDISENGERVIFQAEADGGVPDPAQSKEQEVYVRIKGQETVEASAPQPGATPELTTAEPATFWAASANGNRIFFTTKAQLTTNATTGKDKGEALYEYNVEAKEVRDLTVDTNPADASIGPRVFGVVDASQNGEYIYFVAGGQLVEGKGQHNRANLYMVHDGGKPVFIATLDKSTDRLDWATHPAELEAYVTPDGHHLAFMSTMSLATARFAAGYDNTSPVSGEPVSEVYEYAAPTAEEESNGEGGTLVCASCDPTGAPPAGDAYIGGIAPEGSGGSAIATTSTPFHHVRSVSDSGARVFFSSPPSESEVAFNKSETPYRKVYEYEHTGSGTCRSHGGCLSLLSSPESKEGADFLDASAEGEDVFIGTDSHLASTDTGNLVDVYDVRVDGGAPAAEASTAPCQSECRSHGRGVASGPSLVTGLIGPPGNLPAWAPIRTGQQSGMSQGKGQRRGESKAHGRAGRRERKLHKCRRSARRRHSHSKRKRRRALQRCRRRFGHAARRGHAARVHRRDRRRRRGHGRSVANGRRVNTRRGR